MTIKLVPNGEDEQTLPDGHPNLRYQDEPADDESEALQLDKLTQFISEQWNINQRDKVHIEQEMLRMQEAVNNSYDPTTLSHIRGIGGSEIFIPLTSMQCNAGASWLLSVLNPPGDKAFQFKSSPIAELPATIKEEINNKVKQTLATSAPKNQQGLPTGPDGKTPLAPTDVNKIADNESDSQLKAFNKEANMRAKNMERLVHDQLLSSGWFETLEDFVIDLVTFPSAFIKTTYEYRTEMATVVKDGQFTMEATEKLVERDERVSPFDIYPSPDQKTVHDGNMIERLTLSRNSIHNCIDKPGYNNENILKILKAVDGGGLAEWQSSVDSSRRWQENHSTSFSGQDGSVYGLRFLGYVSIDKMLDWGYSVEKLQEQGYITLPLDEFGNPDPIDLYREIDIDAILIGNHVIKAVPNLDPEGKRPFYMASYRRVPGSFWGKAVAMLASPHQRLVNATARALSNNMGIASGPQIVVYTDRIPNGESLQALRPLHIWQMTSDPTGSNAVPIQFFQPQSNAKELMEVFTYYFDSVGDVTGIPKQAYASDPTRAMPNANTASGLAMLLETASKQIKQAVKNIDKGVIEPRLKYQFRTNMLDPNVPNRYKGDMQIQVIGAQSVVSKAVENQRRMELLQATANPLDMEVLGKDGRATLLRHIIDSYDIHDVVPTQEEMAKKQQAEQGQPKPPSPEEVKLQIEKIRADVRLKDQEMENQNSEAQRKLDLEIANLEFQGKQLELQMVQTQNQQMSEAKLREIALKEQNHNARFETEVAMKQEKGTGI